MKKMITIIGTAAYESWKTAEGSDNKDVIELLDELMIGVLITVVSYEKLKIFGYDEEGILRSKSWLLPADHLVNARMEELLNLKLKTKGRKFFTEEVMKIRAEEAKLILLEYFKDIDVEIDIIHEKIPA
jgi:hypothetical protein